MGKSAKTGNIAVAGIHSTSASSPTTSTSTRTSTSTGSSGNNGSSGNKSYSTKSSGSSSRSSGSGGSSTGSSSSSGSSSGNYGTAGTTATLEATTPSIGSQLYSTYSSGVSGTNAFDAAKAAAASRSIVNNAKSNLSEANVEKVKNIDSTEQQKRLQELSEQQKEQAVNQIDYATQTGVNELQRAYEDALPQYQTQRDQAAVEGQKALDNSVLYARQNGDRGGIGQAQYNSVQNNTANNIQSINSAQVQLYTDTSRQVADLQAKGEYEKADKILSISQDYTEKLMELEKWATEQNVSIDEFNAKIDEWKAEYELEVSKYLTDTELAAADATGAFSNGTLTADMANSINDRYASSGKAMLSAGVIPSDEQLSAMGWTPSQYWVYKMSQASADTYS